MSETKFRNGSGNSIKQFKFDDFARKFNIEEERLVEYLDEKNVDELGKIVEQNYEYILNSYIRQSNGVTYGSVGTKVEENGIEYEYICNMEPFISELQPNDIKIQWYNKKRGNDIQLKLASWKNIIIDSIYSVKLQSKSINEDDNISNLKKKEILQKFDLSHKQLIIDGAPGTGKSYKVNQDVKLNKINHERVTFYQDYEYHNFVGSILPVLNGKTVTYKFVKGPFTKILNDALSMTEEKHYLIIEELTRGNAASIFGDVFQLLDRNEEGFSEYPITHQNIYDSLCESAKEVLDQRSKGKIILPPNLSIICTINSSDQNVYPLDTAFKRRFDYEIKSTVIDGSKFNKFEVHFGKNSTGYAITIDWLEFQKELNKFILINLKLKEDKQVGPYFIKHHNKNNDNIELIQTKLAMYLWNDLHKIHTISDQSIFNENIQTLSKVDELFRTGSKEDIKAILSPEFRKHFGLDNE